MVDETCFRKRVEGVMCGRTDETIQILMGLKSLMTLRMLRVVTKHEVSMYNSFTWEKSAGQLMCWPIVSSTLCDPVESSSFPKDIQMHTILRM